MTQTRAQIISRAARLIGARVGTISSGDATNGTYAVLGGLINTTGDDDFFKGDRLIMLDASAEADKERFIDIWEDYLGRAHFLARSDAGFSNETYIVSPREDYSLSEYREALNAALRETRRTYRQVIPVSPTQKTLPLADVSWLLGDADIDAVWASDCPNLLHNDDFALWSNGPSSAPDGWTMAGSGATAVRTSGGTHSPYSVTLTRSDSDASLTQSIPDALREYLLRSTNANLDTIYVGAWVVCGTASIARIGINNGASTTYSSYHTGSGYAEWLSTSYTPTAAITDLATVLSIDTSNGSAQFHLVGMTSGNDVPDAFKDGGCDAYDEIVLPYSTRNIGGWPVVELGSVYHNQMIVYTRRPFVELTADTDTVDDQYVRAVTAGLLVHLLDVRKPNQDRSRLDVILDEQRRIWTRLTDNFVDTPVPRPMAQSVVTGA